MLKTAEQQRSATHSTLHRPGPQPSRWRRMGRLAAQGGLLMLFLGLGLAGALWWWAGTAPSLAWALTQGARYLPAGQQLHTSDVRGSLRAGGHIGVLRWSSPALHLEVHDLEWGWHLWPLLTQRHAAWQTLRIGELKLTPTPDGPPTAAPSPPPTVALPLSVALPFHIERLTWAGAAPVQVQALSGRYDFDRQTHRLTLENFTLAQGHYRAQAQLHARSPMPLQVQVQGALDTSIPGSDHRLPAQVTVQLEGPLGTPDALLQLQAQITSPSTLQASLQADIAPYQSLPLTQAQAQVQALDLAQLWPQAPHTDLHGSARVHHPAPQVWHLEADLRNQRPGPWDTQHLPADSLQAQADFDGQRWTVAQARIGVGAGHIAVHALHYTPAQQALQGQATGHAVSLAALYSTLPPETLNAHAEAAHTPETGVRWALQAQGLPAPKARTALGRTLAQTQLSAQGQWQDQRLTFTHLRLQTLQAQVQAQNLQLDNAQKALQGQVDIQLPGLQAQWQGQIAQRSGTGSVRVQLQDGARTQSWLAALPALPGLPAALHQPALAVAGQAQLDVSYHGGWQHLQQQGQQAGLLPAPARTAPQPTDRDGAPFRFQAQLQAPQLTLTPPHAPAWHLQALQASVQSQGLQASASVHTQVRSGAQRLSLRTRIESTYTPAGQWQAQISELQAQLYPERHASTASPWAVQLTTPLSLTVAQHARQGLSVQVASGHLQVQAPVPGKVQLQWEASQWRSPPQGAVQVQSRGTLQGLPLAWANALAPVVADSTLLERLGLGGDLLLQANWDIDTGSDRSTPPRARLQVQRSSGDLRLLALADAASTTVRSSAGAAARTDPPVGAAAGLRQAQLQLELQGSVLQGQFTWDSVRAGRIQAQGSSALEWPDQDWRQATWRPDAPLAARLQAQMPDVGLWSTLAPPGWRVKGTLAADVTIAGTRADPQWQGHVAADGFALRSVPDGLDLQDGLLRAELAGRTLRIHQLQLSAGKGSAARILGPSGNRTPAPADGGLLTGSGHVTWQAPSAGQSAADTLRMDFNAQAHSLQVQTRADRQVSLSGPLQAQLEQGQWTLRGQLRIDRASLLLPDTSAPRLGADVHIRRGSARTPAPDSAAALAPAPSVRAARPPDIALALDLGPDFALQGQGITTRLTGTLDITSNAQTQGQPRVTGQVHTEAGRYRAWGQALEVETGIVRFAGPYDNPQLDILALRSNIAVRAGVQVSGSALYPRVRLYAEPDLPDAEKLSWVVLGHSAASGGSETALLQQAALTLLGPKAGSGGGSIAQGLGLDEVGIKGPQAGQDASSTALTLGKRLSSALYVTYEHSLSGTLGTLYLFYDLSRRLTLRGQTGAVNALDLVYSVRYD